MDRSALKNFLRNLKHQKGVTQKRLADELGLQQGVVSEMINGKRNDERLISHLMMTYGYTEEKSDVKPVVEQEKRHYTTNSNGVKFYEQEDGTLLMEVPKIPFPALGSPSDEFASLLKEIDENEVVLFPAEKVYHGKYYAFEVEGDSMDDGSRRSFERGDIVLVRELDKEDWMPRLHISQWPYWVVCWGNCIRLKEIIAQDENVITLHSLNPSPEYTDFDIDLANVYRLFNVIEKKPKPQRFGLK